MVQASQPVNTRQRFTAEREAAASLVEDGTSRVEMATYGIKQKLPLELLLSYRDTWFSHGSEIDVCEELIEKEDGLKTDYRYTALIDKLRQFSELDISERREQLNPMRGNNLTAVIESSICVLLDHEDHLAERLASPSNGTDVLRTTQMRLGHQMEAWIGREEYGQYVERILAIQKTIAYKKYLGTREPAIAHAIRKQLDMSIVEARDLLKQAGDLDGISQEFVGESIMPMSELQRLINEIDEANVGSPITLDEASSVYALGRLVLRFLGESGQSKVMGVVLTLAERKQFRSEILQVTI